MNTRTVYHIVISTVMQVYRFFLRQTDKHECNYLCNVSHCDSAVHCSLDFSKTEVRELLCIPGLKLWPLKCFCLVPS